MSKPELVKLLREATQAGMSDCIKALQECQDNIEEAQKWLKEKGIAKANKKAGAIAYEGVVKAGVSDNKAIIIEINSQTDFTAKNESFIKLVDNVFDTLKKEIKTSGPIEQNKVMVAGKPLSEVGVELTATTGEKIAFRRGEVYVLNGNESITSYTHSNNKIATIIVFDNKVSEDVGKDIAMHAAAMMPKYLDVASVDATFLSSEKEILHKQFLEELKNIKDEKVKSEKEKRANVIVDGKVKKLLKEICLVDQPFVKDTSKTVGQYAKEHGVNIVKMIRYELGEGIERKESNFADEVAAQMR